MAIRKEKGDYIWITWLAKLLSGETVCEWQYWLKTHYKYEKLPEDKNLISWQTKHSRMLSELKRRILDSGRTPLVEDINSFKYNFKDICLIGGRPDLIDIVDDREVIIYDCKTGNKNKSDSIQMLLYLFCLGEGRYRDKILKGILLYSDGYQLSFDKIDISDDFLEDVSYFAKLLTTSTPPLKSPSTNGCRFCDIPKLECGEKIE